MILKQFQVDAFAAQVFGGNLIGRATTFMTGEIRC